MTININPEKNGLRNGAAVAQSVLGEIAFKSSIGGWQEAIEWVQGTFNLIPAFDKWTTMHGSCVPQCIEHGVERRLKINVCDYNGFTVAIINATKDNCKITLEPSNREGECMLENLNSKGMHVKFGAAA